MADLPEPSQGLVRGLGVDFGKTASDYGKHRHGFPPELFERLMAFGVGLQGQRVLDLGTGTGTVARNLALRGCHVTGLDPSAAMMEQAAQLDAEAGVSITYRVAKAEDTGLPAAAFAVVTAGQCWHWFDRAAAGAEIMRLLVPGGRLVVCHYDWIPVPGNVVQATEALIVKHNPAWKMGGGLGMHPYVATDVAVAGFTDIETFSFDVAALYSHEAWRGRIRASAGVAASLSPEQVAAFDAEHVAMLQRDFPEDPLVAQHRCWALIATKPDA
ncbi:MAG: class I SAM-dependent methyltransferase [Dehalococcoidia bacterium]